MLEEDKLGVIEGEVTPTSEQSTTPQGEPVEQSASAQPTGGETPVGKTYTEAELQDIIHKRTKDYGERIRSYESEINQYKLFGSPKELLGRMASPARVSEPKPEAKLNPEDEKARNYMLRIFPELGGVRNFQDKLKNYDDIAGAVQAMNADRAVSTQGFVESSRASLSKMCEDNGIKDPDKQAVVEEMVASIIRMNPEMANKFSMRDASCIADAFNMFKSFGGSSTPSQPNKTDLAATKLKTANLGRTLPKGGAPSAIREKKKLTDEERLEQAFKAVSQPNGE